MLIEWEETTPDAIRANVCSGFKRKLVRAGKKIEHAGAAQKPDLMQHTQNRLHILVRQCSVGFESSSLRPGTK